MTPEDEKLLSEIRVWVADGRASSTDARLVGMVDWLREEVRSLARLRFTECLGPHCRRSLIIEVDTRSHAAIGRVREATPKGGSNV